MSERQRRANRKNAKKSTGPRTPQGKEAVRHNAVRHGLLARAALLPGEDSEALNDLREATTAYFAPEGDMEQILIDLIVSHLWRLKRVAQVESGLYARPIYEAEATRLWEEGQGITMTVEQWKQIKKLYKDHPEPEEITLDEDKEALKQADEAESYLRSEAVQLGIAFVRDAANRDAFLKLSRYETAIYRALWRAVEELRTVQQSRGGSGTADVHQALPRETTA